MAIVLVNQRGSTLVDDAGFIWKRPDNYLNPSHAVLSGLEGLADLGFDWEGFGQASAGIGGSVAAIIAASKSNQYAVQGGLTANTRGVGGGFSMSTGTMMMLGLGAALLIVLMKK